ncbi:hypothetical protein [Lysinibacillus telephonicus]|uniref:Uncharacterized protein n=1 Tax=Lysinibacillus telephonicus TaxID=1714840 RepID=A0A3S0HX54_9BACI|nr:hypothetical protein [Lysinibacillus telephonicus]RTQ89723.1 hypothetical protein EKG35_15980 [Lysinibacillus telephonicus]
MRLPMNITSLINKEIKIEQMDGHLFQRVVYDFARKVNGKVNDWFPPSYPLNYFCIDIEIGDTVVSILLHEFFPYAAIASYINEFQIQFLDYKNLMLELNPYLYSFRSSILK